MGLSQRLEDMKRRLDGFDAHDLPNEDMRRAIYKLYEIVKDMHTTLTEVDREFADAHEAFTKMADQQETMQARQLLGAIKEQVEGKKDDEDTKRTGQYL
jgi:predicted deacylase